MCPVLEMNRARSITVTPDLPGTDIIRGVKAEIERNAFRMRNGIQYVAGYEWAPLEPTESTVVWRLGPARLLRYRAPGQSVRFREPVLAFTGLVSRPYWADLAVDNSFVQRLMAAGFDAFVLDWGIPGAEDSGITLETYLQDVLPAAITAALREAGADQVNLVGYCMGGNMALQALAGEGGLPVRNLVVMTTIIDFTKFSHLADTLRDGRLPPASLLDESGNVPAKVVEKALSIRRPTAGVVNYANLLQNLWNDEYLSGYQAMARWVREHVPVAGAAFLQIVDQWLIGNGFLENRLRLDGRAVDLGSIDLPVLAVIALRDDLVPEPASRPISKVVTGAELDLLTPDSGHTGLVAGRTGSRVTLPRIFDWLAEHSEVRM